jgi:hypothetical protein
MNLQLNPQQALALYELIIAATASSPKSELSDRLGEVKIKLQSSVVEALDAIYSTSNKDKFSSWIKKEQDKISQLNSQLEKLKTSSGYASGSLEPDDGLHFPLRK